MTDYIDRACALVSTHSRPKAAGPSPTPCAPPPKFQHTAARRRLVLNAVVIAWLQEVSTHSRPKAAGSIKSWELSVSVCFNTQPPEGGWHGWHERQRRRRRFNTQPPEGGWPTIRSMSGATNWFQHTAARRRLGQRHDAARRTRRSFNTQPPEGGWSLS